MKRNFKFLALFVVLTVLLAGCRQSGSGIEYTAAADEDVSVTLDLSSSSTSSNISSLVTLSEAVTFTTDNGISAVTMTNLTTGEVTTLSISADGTVTFDVPEGDYVTFKTRNVYGFGETIELGGEVSKFADGASDISVSLTTAADGSFEASSDVDLTDVLDEENGSLTLDEAIEEDITSKDDLISAEIDALVDCSEEFGQSIVTTKVVDGETIVSLAAITSSSNEDDPTAEGAVANAIVTELNFSNAEDLNDIAGSAEQESVESQVIIIAEDKQTATISSTDISDLVDALDGDVATFTQNLFEEAEEDTTDAATDALDAIAEAIENTGLDLAGLDLTDSTGLTELNTALTTAQAEIKAQVDDLVEAAADFIEAAADETLDVLNEIATATGGTVIADTVIDTAVGAVEDDFDNVVVDTDITEEDTTGAAETGDDDDDDDTPVDETLKWEVTQGLVTALSVYTANQDITDAELQAIYDAVDAELAVVGDGGSNEIATIENLLTALKTVDTLGHTALEKDLMYVLVKYIDLINIGSFGANTDTSELFSYSSFEDVAEDLSDIIDEYLNENDAVTRNEFYVFIDTVVGEFKAAAKNMSDNIYIDVNSYDEAYITKAHIKLLSGSYKLGAAYSIMYAGEEVQSTPQEFFNSFGITFEIYNNSYVKDYTEYVTGETSADNIKSLAENYIRTGLAEVQAVTSNTSGSFYKAITATGNVLSISTTEIGNVDDKADIIEDNVDDIDAYRSL
jgi:hypothetical protein